MQFPFRLNNENHRLKTASKINNLITTKVYSCNGLSWKVLKTLMQLTQYFVFTENTISISFVIVTTVFQSTIDIMIILENHWRALLTLIDRH